MRVLAVETSCDDTSVACVDDTMVRSNMVSSQVDLHAHFGGVVPELASRAHLTNVLPVTQVALEAAGWKLDDVQAVAATAGPGLIGAVLMGLTFGKTLAWSLDVPFVGVHHIEGHILANDIEEPMALPAVVLVVSGGHTETVYVPRAGVYEHVGRTRDDAAGETFDKTAKLLGLGYPGGPILEKLARSGRPEQFTLPRALWKRGDLDFSFSGLKTAVRLAVEGLGEVTQQDRCDVAWALQDVVVSTLVEKTRRAINAHRGSHDEELRGVYLAGGVAANGPLRDQFGRLAAQEGLTFRPPALAYCTDNAAMIGWAARTRLLAQTGDPLDLPAFARAPLASWRNAED